MIPAWWPSLVLALALFRVMRLIAWDTFPPVERARAWMLGRYFVRTGTHAEINGLAGDPGVSVRYRRPLLADLIGCSFCLGLWLAGLEYALWLEWPSWTMYGAYAFALSGTAGLISKNLDP